MSTDAQRVAVVTGGDGEHGRTVAVALAARGVRVALLDERFGPDPLLDPLVADGRVIRHELSLEDVAAVRRAVDGTAERFGRVDVLVNAVVEAGPDGLRDVQEEAWHRCVRVNMKLPFFALQACVPHMRTAGGGRVITFSSVLSGLTDGHRQVVLGIAKAGVNSMTRQWAVDLSPDNVQANSLWLGVADPARTDGASALPTPEQVAGFVTFLALDATPAINGTQIAVDSGAALLRQGRMLAGATS